MNIKTHSYTNLYSTHIVQLIYWREMQVMNMLTSSVSKSNEYAPSRINRSSSNTEVVLTSSSSIIVHYPHSNVDTIWKHAWHGLLERMRRTERLGKRGFGWKRRDIKGYKQCKNAEWPNWPDLGEQKGILRILIITAAIIMKLMERSSHRVPIALQRRRS